MRRFGGISDLKLRLSYGRVGNSAISPYQTIGLLNRTWYATNGNYLVGFQPGAIPNPDLRWETTDKFDVGLDFGVLDQRISGSFDAYRDNTHDLLLPRALPYSSGYSSVLQNVGATKNIGLEFGLSTQNLRNWHRFGWTSDFNISTNKNRIVRLQNGLTADVGSLRWVGQPISVYYDYKYIGLWQLADTALARTSCGCAAGSIRVQDVNGDGTVDTNLLGPDIVFSWLDKPDATFTLGGYSSIWTLRGGGDAVCRADLDAYGWKGGKESTRVLASTAGWTASARARAMRCR
jgi:outer membrane receptor protein involved in Fe transport